MPSDKILKEKQELVSDLAGKLKNACAGVFVDYKGISVEDDTKLRKDLRDAGIEYSVIKNTLLLRASQEAGISGLDEILKGTTAVAISNDDYVAAARILSGFAKNNEFFRLKAGFVDGNVIDAKEVDALSKLPNKEILIAQVLGSMNAPISGLANVLNGTIRGLVIALNAVAQKQSA